MNVYEAMLVQLVDTDNVHFIGESIKHSLPTFRVLVIVHMQQTTTRYRRIVQDILFQLLA